METNNTVDLSKFQNEWYNPGRSALIRLIWYCCNALFFQSYLFPSSSLKVFLLRLFGAQIGKGCVIKPSVNIKYPWKLAVGNNVWIGEKVWIDNLGEVRIGNNVCISQGAFILCGNHDYKKISFDLMVGDISLEDGCWIGAKSIVCPGVTVSNGAILTVGSVASFDLQAQGIYKGNPAVLIKERSYQD